jgi:hypothetical protein
VLPDMRVPSLDKFQISRPLAKKLNKGHRVKFKVIQYESSLLGIFKKKKLYSKVHLQPLE